MQPPTDIIESAIVLPVWPADETISVFKKVIELYQAAHTARQDRYDELDRSKSIIAESMVSEDFDTMHQRLAGIAKNQRTIAEHAGVVVTKGQMMVDECELGQQLLLSVAEEFAPTIRSLLDENLFQAAALELATAQGAAAAKVATLAETVTAWLGPALGDLKTITPAGPQHSGSNGHGKPSVTGVDFRHPKQEGGSDGGAGRVGQSIDPKPAAEGEGKNQGKESHGKVSTDSEDSPSTSEKESSASNEHGHVGTSSKDVGTRSPASTSQLPSAPASPLGGGSGGGTPSPSGLTSGLGGFKPPTSLEGMSSMARPTPPSLPSNPAGSVGSGSGSGGGAPRFSAPVAPAVPPASVPPAALSQAVGASPSSTAGGFGPSSNALQPITHTPAVASTTGLGSAGMGGVMASAAPTTAAVGPSPTPSPGLSQGAVNAGGAAAAGAGAGASASGVNVMPSAFSDEGPQRLDQFAQMAVNAVKVLAPAMAGMPGLLVAAAVVRVPGGIPQVVITTNEGAGYLPQGCYLPSTMTHAFFDVDQLDFDNKWFGWVDPARTLVDYVAVRSAGVSGEVELLGLASSGLVSADVKTAFPQAVPSVRPDEGVKPLGPDRGRNAHRLKVLSPSWYADVQASSSEDRNKAAVRATEAAMRLSVAAPLREAGGPWQIMQSGRPLSDAEWAAFKERYDQEVKMTGAVRPGFMTSSQPGQMGAQYVERFQLVRAMETLLAWRDISAVSPEDIIYTGHEAGADISHVLD
ncbi:hypothetical protein PP613_23480 [Mycobacteroides abscessus]|nr:hypothetical protein [Mycobacteroides abscessus]MDM2412305.1 hypothetical protein [Mycobacteroides abscessus]